MEGGERGRFDRRSGKGGDLRHRACQPVWHFCARAVATEHIGAFREAFVGNNPIDDPARSEALVLVFVGAVRRKSLVGIAAHADALNRDYIAEPAFRGAVDRLAARGLISVTDAGIAATESGRTLLAETKTGSWIDQAHEIARRLPERPIRSVRDGLIPEGTYSAAISKYLELSRAGQRRFL